MVEVYLGEVFITFYIGLTWDTGYILTHLFLIAKANRAAVLFTFVF